MFFCPFSNAQKLKAETQKNLLKYQKCEELLELINGLKFCFKFFFKENLSKIAVVAKLYSPKSSPVKIGFQTHISGYSA